MDTKTILDQLLQSGRGIAAQGQDIAEEKLGVPEQGAEREAMLSGMGKGALAAGALALLLGTKGGRRLGGTALKLGSLAAVGGVAYKAYQNWQSSQSGQTADPGLAIDQLAAPDAESRSQKLLRAMIAAAKADGHIDDKELASLREQIGKLGLGDSAVEFFREEVRKPLDARSIAADADSPETAAEIYLASRLLINTENAMERAYLDELVSELNLDPGLVQQLESTVV